jgi:hypothetical protein
MPIDTTTGRQAGGPVHTGTVELTVGYLVTHPDGFEARLGPDRARAEVYLRQHRAMLIEPMYVRRNLPTHPAPPTA